jgi:recombinational DNA repair ATPase RecF
MELQELIKSLPISQAEKDELVKMSATASPKDVLTAIDAKLAASDKAIDAKYSSLIADMKKIDDDYEKEAADAEKEFDDGMDKLKEEAAVIQKDTLKNLDDERAKQIKASL